MAGPKQNLEKGWETITKHIVLDKPMLSNNYLGCEHVETNMDISDNFPEPSLKNFNENVLPERDPGNWGVPTVPVRGMELRMHGFIQQCITKCCELAKVE